MLVPERVLQPAEIGKGQRLLVWLLPPNSDPFEIVPCAPAVTSLLIPGRSSFPSPVSVEWITIGWLICFHVSALLCFLLHQPGCYLFCGLCPCGFLLLYRRLGTRTTELKWTWSFDEFWQSLCTRVLMYSKLELLRWGLSLHKLLLPLMTTMDAFNSCHLLHRILVRCGCRGRSLSLCWCPWLREINKKIRLKPR